MNLSEDILIKLLALSVALAAYTGTVRRRMFDAKRENSAEAKKNRENILNNKSIQKYFELDPKVQRNLSELYNQCIEEKKALYTLDYIEKDHNYLKPKSSLDQQSAFKGLIKYRKYKEAYRKNLNRNKSLERYIKLITIGDVLLIVSISVLANSLFLKFHQPFLNFGVFPKDANASGIWGIRWLILALIWLIGLHILEASISFKIPILNRILGKSIPKGNQEHGANNPKNSPVSTTTQTETTEEK